MISALISETVVSLCGSAPLTGDLVPAMKGCVNFHFYILAIHTIRKVKYLSKNSILTKPQHFHKFFTQIFLTIFLVKSKLSTAQKSKNHNIFTSFSPLIIFLVKSKLSTAKKSKTTTFSRDFHPKKIDDFLGKSKLNFWTKNEDFEQCVY